MCRNPAAAAHLLQTQRTIPGSCPDSPGCPRLPQTRLPAPAPRSPAPDAPGRSKAPRHGGTRPAAGGAAPSPSLQRAGAASTGSSDAATKSSASHSGVHTARWDRTHCSPLGVGAQARDGNSTRLAWLLRSREDSSRHGLLPAPLASPAKHPQNHTRTLRGTSPSALPQEPTWERAQAQEFATCTPKWLFLSPGAAQGQALQVCRQCAAPASPALATATR